METQFRPPTLLESHYATNLEAASGEVYDPKFESLIQQMLVRVGEDPYREGLERTPLRVAKAMDFLTGGYRTSVEEVLNDALFEVRCDEMVVVRDIEFYSMCEHHPALLAALATTPDWSCPA